MQWLRLLTLIAVGGVQFCSFLIVSLSQSLSLFFMYSDQRIKYWMPRGFPLTSSLLLDYHVKQYIRSENSNEFVSMTSDSQKKTRRSDAFVYDFVQAGHIEVVRLALVELKLFLAIFHICFIYIFRLLFLILLFD